MANSGRRDIARATIGAVILLLGFDTGAAQEPRDQVTLLAQGENDQHSPTPRRSIGMSLSVTDVWWPLLASAPSNKGAALSFFLPVNERAGLTTALGTVKWTATERRGRDTGAVDDMGRVRRPSTGPGGEDAFAMDIRATHVTVSYVGLVRPQSRVRFQWRVGGGYYRLSSHSSDFDSHYRVGAHGGAGIEIPLGARVGIAGHLIQHCLPGRSNRLSPTPLAIRWLTMSSAGLELKVYF
jgi:hypothetical protein